jgi:hypothetical protein
LKLGHKFHSTVKAPCINLNAESSFPISAGSELARVIIETNIFVWNEVSMAHKYLITGLDRLFKDLMQDDIPFGGKLVVIVKYLGLTENMRGRNRAESERASIEQDNALLLAMGDGALENPYPEENPHLVRLPASMCISVTDDEAGISKLVRDVCGGLPETNEDQDFLADRAILCPP